MANLPSGSSGTPLVSFAAASHQYTSSVPLVRRGARAQRRWALPLPVRGQLHPERLVGEDNEAMQRPGATDVQERAGGRRVEVLDVRDDHGRRLEALEAVDRAEARFARVAVDCVEI